MSCHHTAVIRWIAAAGAFVVSLDSMVNVAFPSIAAGFGAPPEAMRWVIICYVLTYSLVSFAGGNFGDRIGHARVFRVGAGLSAAAFALTAAAPTFEWLLIGRIVQGFAGGLVYGTAPGLITLASAPSQRGRALGFLTGAIAVAGVAGPMVAGVLIDAIDWRAVFAVRIPLALGLLVWALVRLPASRTPIGHRWPRAAEFARADVLRPCVSSFLANAGIFAIWLLAPFYLSNRRGLDAFAAGLMFMLAPLGSTVASPLGGALADRVGSRCPVIVGLLIEVVGLAAMTASRETTPMVLVGVSLFVAGFGLGLFQAPNMADVMRAFGMRQQGAAGGLIFMARTLGVVTGVATLAQIFSMRRASAGFDAAFATAFTVAAVGVALAAIGAMLPSRARVEPSASINR